MHGLVQGVNFRITFKRVAYRLGLRGEIWNDLEDTYLVHATVEGKRSSIDQFVSMIKEYSDRPEYDGEMASTFSLIEVDTIEVDRRDVDEYSIDAATFQVKRPELEGADRVQIETPDKISMGGVVYQQFHQDHNRNFHTLERKFGAVSEGIEHANIGIDRLGKSSEKTSETIEQANQGIDRLGTTFGKASEGIEHANQSIDGLGDHLTNAVSDLVKWMKIGIFTLVGMGVVYIVVRVSIG